MSQSAYIFDVTTETFDRYVLENSFHKPVLVDFWAEWCAPCKALMPVLASITERYAGELLMAKVDCDAQPELTTRFGIRSLTTVLLFKDGQPVDGLAGIQPESAILAMIEPHASAPAADPEATSNPPDEAAALFEAGDAKGVIALLQPLIGEQPDPAMLILLGRALAQDQQFEAAEQVLSAVSNQDQHKAALGAARAQLTFLRQARDLTPRTDPEPRLKTDAGDSDACYQLALHDLADNNHEGALQRLLQLFMTDRQHAEGAAHRTLLQVFELLGSEHPLTITYRRKLYQALY